MDAIFLIILVVYALCFIFGMRHCVILLSLGKKNELTLLEEKYKNLVSTKDNITHDKQHIADESMKTFTLYEITKEITKSLNEKEAFRIFQQKLRDNIVFKECHLFDSLTDTVRSFKESQRNFIFSIKAQRRTIGYLVVEGIRQEEKEKANILCHQYAFALRRVRLYQEIEQTAITDSLTQTYTRRYTMERLNEEMERSKLRNMHLAFLMIDVDHFKNFNDTYGHITGDQILREIGSIIKNNIREIDIAGRFGGEEFCVILPDTDLDGAQYAAERIRSSVEQAQIKAYDHVVQATISLGIAIYPRDAKKAIELVDKADWTLYKAKKLGRNQFCYFGGHKES